MHNQVSVLKEQFGYDPLVIETGTYSFVKSQPTHSLGLLSSAPKNAKL